MFTTIYRIVALIYRILTKRDPLNPAILDSLFSGIFYTCRTKCWFGRIEQYYNNMLFFKIDLIQNKTKNDEADTTFKHQHAYLAMNCVPGFIATTFPE